MNPELPNNPREELELRLTALLLGELLEPETASVRAAIATDPELQKLHDDLKQTIHLVREATVSADESVHEESVPLKLSEERRKKLLNHFKLSTPRQLGIPQLPPLRKPFRWLVPALACAAVIVVMAGLLLPAFSKAKLSTHRLESNARSSPAVSYKTDGQYPPDANQLQVVSVSKKTALTMTPLPNDSESRVKEVNQLTPSPGTIYLPTPSETAVTDPILVSDSGGEDGRIRDSGLGGDYWSRPATPSSRSKATREPGGSSGGGSGGNRGGIHLYGNRFDSVNVAPPATRAPVVTESTITIANPVNKDEIFEGFINQPQSTRYSGDWVDASSSGGGGRLGIAKTDETLKWGLAGENVVVVSADNSRHREGGDSKTEKWDVNDDLRSYDSDRMTTPKFDGRFHYAVPGAEVAGPATIFGGVTVGDIPLPMLGFKQAPARRPLGSDQKGLARSDVPAALATPALVFSSESLEPTFSRGEHLAQGQSAPVLNLPNFSELDSLTKTYDRFTALNINEEEKKPSASGKPQATHETPDVSLEAVGYVNMAELQATKKRAHTIVLPSTPPSAEPSSSDSFLIAGLRDSADDSAGEKARNLSSLARSSVAENQKEEAQKASEKTERELDRQEAQKDLETSRLKMQLDTSLPRIPVTNAPIPQPEVQTSENNFSTFSLNVSDVSFKLAAASLEKGQMPDAASVRSEEFINAFDYRDPEAAAGSPVAFAWERARYPFAHNRDLLRFSLKTAAAGRQAGRPLNIVLLLDNSGSMERADRVGIIREALRVLAAQLQLQDKLSVITFARTPRLVADGISGDKAGEVADQVGGLTPQGGTNLEDAMNLAYQTAAKHYLASGINRVVVLTDGAANLGNVEPELLKQKVEAQRQQGIALDCFGIGWEGFNDDLLEVLSRNGDGRYGFINSPGEASTEFASQLAGALKVAASDVKVQVEFNPKRVTTYRQIGYAKHQLTKEQFRDNSVDAAEIAAQEAGNALYTVEVNPAGEGPLGTVRVRYKIPGTADYREQAWDVPFSGNAVPLEQANPAMRLAASASAFSEWLAVSPFAGEVTPDALLNYLGGVPEAFGADSRSKKLEWMIRQAKSIGGK